MKEYFLSLIITGEHNNTNEWCVTTQCCFRLDGKFWAPDILRPSTTTVEAPFSSALQPKLPLWKYLMAHNGKTLFITMQPSGMKVHDCMMLKQSSIGKVHAYPAICPETNKDYYIYLYISLSEGFFFLLSVLMAATSCCTCADLLSESFCQPCFGAMFASSGELG